MYYVGELLFKNICRRDKKKLIEWDNNLKEDKGIGYGHINALIRFFYHIDPDQLDMDNERDMDKRCQLEAELKWLSKKGLLGMAQLPLEFK